MVIRSTTYQMEAFCNQCICKCFRVIHYLLLILFELWFQCLSEADSFCCNNMHQRTTLSSREDCFVNCFCMFFLTHDYSASWSSQCLVRCRCNYICVWNRILVKSCCNQSCDMCHIYEEISANFFCNICKDIESDLSWISGSSCNNHLWLTFMCKFSNLIVIQYSVIVDVIRYKII